MKLSDVLKIAIKNMRVNILQTIIIITVMTIGMGVITVFLGFKFVPREKRETEEQNDEYILTINSGGETFLEENIIAMGKEIFEPVDFKIDHLYELKKSCSAVDYIFPAYFQEANIYLPNNSEEKEEKRVSFARTIPNHFDFIDLELEKGNTFTKQDVKNKNRVIVLRKDIAEKLFGTENPLGKEIKTEKRGSFEVIGVFRENSQDKYLKKREGFIPFSVTDFLSTNEIEHIKVGFKEKNRIPKAERQIENYLENEFGGGYRIDNNVNMENDKSNKFNKYNLIFAFVFSLGLLIALINILNILWARVLSYTESIGILKSLGFSRSNILKIFLCEILLLGLSGGILGLLLSYGGQIFLENIIGESDLVFDYRVIFSSIFISCLASLTFGIYPAYLACQIDPVKALRTE